MKRVQTPKFKREKINVLPVLTGLTAAEETLAKIYAQRISEGKTLKRFETARLDARRAFTALRRHVERMRDAS